MKILIGAVLSLLVVNVNAALIDNGIYTTDNVSGLDWLDLSVTSGQSYNYAIIANPGWRYATNSEVENLFAISFPEYTDTDSFRHWSESWDGAYSQQAADIFQFSLLFGPSDSYTHSAGTDVYNYGMYDDEGGVLRMMGAFYREGQDYNAIYSIASISQVEQYREGLTGSLGYGTYLVRTSVVPVPAAAWLFGSGLIGLVGLARRKKS